MHTNSTSYEDETIRGFWDDQDAAAEDREHDVRRDRAEIEEERRAESIRDRQRDDDDR